ncbi:MAG: ABC transporter permease [Ilumatobacter fluminis]|uniref:ABC transporter permease n=1 Tax=Ilumatobacter fluminis TaxID=467091 RepID=UPI0032EE8EE2
MYAVPKELDAELVDVQAATRLRPYLRQLWSRLDYAWYVADSELRQRQIATLFGSLWHLLNPILSIAVYYVIFGLVLETDRGVDNFVAFLAVGLFVFQYTQRSVTHGSASIVSNRGLVQAIHFPRALLPISSALTETLAAIPTFVVAGVVALALGEPLTWRWLVFPAIFLAQAVFNLGCSFVSARLTTHFRDTQQLLPFFFRLLLYGSGVLFSVEAYLNERQLRLLVALNPIFDFIELARWSLLGRDVDAGVVVSAAVWTFIAFVGGFLWFRSGEHAYSRV